MSDIVNIGICAVDAIGQTIDEFPPPGGLRFFDQLTMTTGGNAVNCSIALAKMGVECHIMVKVGNDPLGDFVISELRRHGVNAAGVIRSANSHTPYTFVCVFSDGQRSFFHTMGSNGTLCLQDIDLELVRRAKYCFVTGTMLMRTFDGRQTAELLKFAGQAGAKTLLDTVYTDAVSQKAWQAKTYPALPFLDYFIPSLPEARAITGLEQPTDMALAFQDLGCKNVVIKLDERGVFCRDSAGAESMVPSYRVAKVVDTTGAGDSWSAGFLAGLYRGMDIPDAALLGNATAAHCIRAPGASTGIVALDEIKEFQQHTPLNPAPGS
ncbi:MAG: carbohydrate kinase family protein [Planctomycetota bacterium]|jgi:sugar/nucleoside kinase (ribokinase family)